MVGSRIDNEMGSKNISSHFVKTSGALYNKIKNGPKLDSIREKTNMAAKDDLSLVIISKIDDKLL